MRNIILVLFASICCVLCQDNEINVGLGENIVLDCADVVGDDVATSFEQWYDPSGGSLIWMVNGGFNQTGSPWSADRMAADVESHTFSLNAATFADAGNYKCVRKANQDYEKYFNVNVYGNPELNAASQSQVVENESGDSLKVASCKLTGTSKPYSIQWSDQDGLVVELPDAEEIENADFAELVDVTLDLVMPVQSKSHNNAEYTCQITHPLGSDSTTVNLDITAAPKITDFPSAEEAIDIAESKKYQCSATAVPVATVSWYDPAGNELTSSDKTVGILEINDASYEQSGIYKCVARNGAGQDDEKSFKLVVQGPPTMVSPESSTTDARAEEGQSTVKVQCTANAVPMPSIEWSLGSLNGTSQVGEGGSSIMIVDVKPGQDPSDVNCTATNSKGSVQRQFIVYAPAASPGTAGTSLIIGILVAVLILLALIFFIVFRICTSRKQPVDDEECGEKGEDEEDGEEDEGDEDVASTKAGCCDGFLKKKSTSVVEENETKDIDEVKETKEDGTADEKQKLTEAEEAPAEEKGSECKDNGTNNAVEHVDEVNAENKEENKEESAEGEQPAEKSPKKKMRLSFPTNCFRKPKKDLKGEENDVEKVVEDEVNEEEQSPKETEAPASPQKVKEADQDSGKGDTLDKGLEAPAATEEVEAK